MSSNSSFFNNSFLGQQFPTFSCFSTSLFVYIVGTFCVTKILLLLPLCIFILCFGVQQLQLKTSTMSHCDSFTYHLASMEMIGTLGWIVSFCGSCMKNRAIFKLASAFFPNPWYGQIFFHTLTCMERYLAVIHPITYVTLKNDKWIRIRNRTSGCIWLLCIFANAFVSMTNIIYLETSLLTSSTIIVFYCSLAVLWVLTRPGPGELGNGRKRVEQSKLRAFYIIIVFLMILMLKLSFGLIAAGLEVMSKMDVCTITELTVWFSLPSSLVLPLLFLKKRKYLVCCK
nr:uncharacterized protein LOC129165089 [Nothobranchius furzeri]